MAMVTSWVRGPTLASRRERASALGFACSKRALASSERRLAQLLRCRQRASACSALVEQGEGRLAQVQLSAKPAALEDLDLVALLVQRQLATHPAMVLVIDIAPAPCR